MLADEFIRKVWFPVGMLAVAVTFVLAFLIDDPVSDNVVGLIIGLTVIGLPVLYAVYRRVTGPRSATDRADTTAGQTTAGPAATGPETTGPETAAGSRRI